MYADTPQKAIKPLGPYGPKVLACRSIGITVHLTMLFTVHSSGNGISPGSNEETMRSNLWWLLLTCTLQQNCP